MPLSEPPVKQKRLPPKTHWKPGQSGNLNGRPKLDRSILDCSEFLTQPLNKQVTAIRSQAAEIAYRMGDDLRSELIVPKQKKDYQRIREIAGPWGIAADKLLKDADSDSIQVKFPAAILSNMQVAIVVKSNTSDKPQSVDNSPSSGVVIDAQPIDK